MPVAASRRNVRLVRFFMVVFLVYPTARIALVRSPDGPPVGPTFRSGATLPCFREPTPARCRRKPPGWLIASMAVAVAHVGRRVLQIRKPASICHHSRAAESGRRICEARGRALRMSRSRRKPPRITRCRRSRPAGAVTGRSVSKTMANKARAVAVWSFGAWRPAPVHSGGARSRSDLEEARFTGPSVRPGATLSAIVRPLSRAATRAAARGRR